MAVKEYEAMREVQQTVIVIANIIRQLRGGRALCRQLRHDITLN